MNKDRLIKECELLSKAELRQVIASLVQFRKKDATPCERLGYFVGDCFEIVAKDDLAGFVLGQFVTLYKDDGGHQPLFFGSNDEFSLCDDKPGAYLELTQVKPVT